MGIILNLRILLLLSELMFFQQENINSLTLKKGSVTSSEIGIEVNYSPRYKVCKIFINSEDIRDLIKNESIKPDRILGEIAEPSIIKFEKLQPNTEYFIYAVVYDRLGTPIKMEVLEVNTDKPEKIIHMVK